MNKVRILHLEDIQADADLVKREFVRSHFPCEWNWVKDKPGFLAALEEFSPDVILSDHSMPGFTSIEAFATARKTGIDVPFILVTATISEDFGVMMLKEGIADYVLKDRLQRLPSAVTNALEKRTAELEKRKYLEEIIRNEKRYRGLIENSDDVIAVNDADMKPVYISQNFERITGWSIKERLAKGGMSLVHPEDRPILEEATKNALQNPGKHFLISYRVPQKDGPYRWLEGTIINMLDDDAIQGLVYNMRDITAHRAAEDSLRQSQANLKAIIENSGASIYSLDREFRYLTFNSLLADTLRMIYGLEVKPGDPVYDFLNKLDPAQAKEWESVYTSALAGDKVQFVRQFSIGDFNSFVRFSINPIYEGDEVTGLSCFAYDVTKEKTADLLVAKSEARFRALIENNFDAITLRDEKGVFIYTSPSFERMLGYSTDEFNSETLGENLYHPDHVEDFRNVQLNLKLFPGKAFPFIGRARHKAGHYLWVDMTMTNLLGDENVRGIVANGRDITERKEAEAQKERITGDLIQRNKDLEQFAYIVSHNLRAPVANILGLGSLIEAQELGEADRLIALRGIAESTKRLDDVITDLNHILQSKKEVNEKRERVIFKDLVDDILQSIASMVSKNKVSVITDFSEIGGLSTIRTFLYSIFYNLISNSIKYKNPDIDPVIEIRSAIHEDGIRLEFKDNGMGIDLKKQGSKVFGLYKRFHPDRAEGKGMGLFMVRTQIETLGGTISIESEVNKGTVFTIDL